MTAEGRSAEEARDVFLAKLSERSKSQDHTIATAVLRGSFPDRVFEKAWRAQFEEDRSAFRSAVREDLSAEVNAVEKGE